MRFMIAVFLASLIPQVRAQDSPAFGAITLRVSEMMAHPQLRTLLDSELTADMRATMQKKFGAGFADIERITMVMTSPDAQVITLKKDVDRAAMYKSGDLTEVAAAGSVAGLPNMTLAIGKETGVVAVQGKQIIAVQMWWNRRGPNGETLGFPEAAKSRVIAALPNILKLDADAQPSAPVGNELIAGFLKIDEIVRMDPQATQQMPPPIRPLMAAKGAQFSATLKGTKFELTVRIAFPDAEKAATGQKSAADGLTMLGELLRAAAGQPEMKEVKEFGQVIEALQASLKAVKPEVKGNDVVAVMNMELDDNFFKAMEKAVRKVREAASRLSMSNNFKQVILAMHSFNDQSNTLPENIYSKDGKTALLSWRVQILPFIEEEALYREFKLDEPWDSEHNKKLIPRMPKIFLHPMTKTDVVGGTFMQSFVGEEKHAVRPRMIKGKLTKLTIQGIPDGSSNTFLVVEGESAVPWTKPEDIAFDPDGGRPKVGKHWDGGFIAAFGDGVVRVIPGKISDKNLKLYITINDGQVVSDD